MNTLSESYQDVTRLAVVAGGSRGIGLATCLRLQRCGYKVIAASRTPPEEGSFPEAVGAGTRSIEWARLDIADGRSIDSLMKDVKSRYGRLDAVVNSAGMNYVAPVALVDMARSEEVIRVNLLGALALSKAAVRIMTRQRHGRIVHVGSISGLIGSPYSAVYAASKAGVAGLTKSLALEVAAIGITVNAVQPGTIHTDLFERSHGARAKLKGIGIEEQKRAMEAEYPHKRLITVEEVAATICFLLSDDAASITGHLLNVDGGRSIV